jgi:hypothetical protein
MNVMRHKTLKMPRNSLIVAFDFQRGALKAARADPGPNSVMQGAARRRI